MFSFREPRSYGKARIVLALILGAIAGFAFGDWLRGKMEAQSVQDVARRARAELAAAVCADDFMQQPDARQALGKLVALHWDKRPELLAREGWATMPDRAKPESATARLCAEKLGEAYTSLRRSAPVVPAAR